MIDLENIFYYTVFQITNDATVFWLEYCEDTFKTISKFDEDLEKTRKHLDELEIPKISRLDDILALGAVQGVNVGVDYTQGKYYRMEVNQEAVNPPVDDSFFNTSDSKACSIKIETVQVDVTSFSAYEPFDFIVQSILHNPDVIREKTHGENIFDHNWFCNILRQRSLLAYETRRGIGNTIVIGEQSSFDLIMHEENPMKEIFYITRSHLLKPNQMIMVYRGEIGVAMTDSGVIFIPSNILMEGRTCFYADIRPSYFRILELEYS